MTAKSETSVVQGGSVTSIETRIANDFRAHEVDAQKREAMEAIRARLKDTADFIARNVPTGREQATALTKLEETMFWANAGISR